MNMCLVNRMKNRTFEQLNEKGIYFSEYDAEQRKN